MNPNRYFSSDPSARDIARQLYQTISTLPIVSPHGHVDPRLFSDPNATLGTPADLFIIPDHYVTRMLYSQGIPLEALLEGDHRSPLHHRRAMDMLEHHQAIRDSGWNGRILPTFRPDGVVNLDASPPIGWQVWLSVTLWIWKMRVRWYKIWRSILLNAPIAWADSCLLNTGY